MLVYTCILEINQSNNRTKCEEEYQSVLNKHRLYTKECKICHICYTFFHIFINT